jgi:RimJ/RimL family protein N-acetyltransferase
MKLNKIVADLRTENIKSVKLLEKRGFIKGEVHEISIEGDVKAEMAVYYLEKAAFEENLNR